MSVAQTIPKPPNIPNKALAEKKLTDKEGPTENSMVLWLLMLFLLVHLGGFMMNYIISHFRSPIPVEDWSVDVDLMLDSPDLKAPKENVIPAAEKAKEAAVPENILPQLPKNFSINSQPQDMTHPTEESVDETKTAEETPPEVNNGAQLHTPVDEANKIDKEEAIKRLAIEKLRLEEKKDKAYLTAKEEALARLKDESIPDKSLRKIGPQGKPGATTKIQKYLALLEAAIRKNYTLPETFKMQQATVRVRVMVSINERGMLNKMSIHESSGNGAFDQLTLDAIKHSEPLPKPPEELLNEAIIFNFTP